MSLLVATASLLLLATGSIQDAPERPQRPEVLIVPIEGTIGADATVDGVATALQLLERRPIETVIVEFDAWRGDLGVGIELAGLLAAIPEGVDVVGLLRRAGGPALPAAWVCDAWFVQSSISIRVPDPRGGMTDRVLGPDRVVMQALPALSRRATQVEAELSRVRAACRTTPETDRTTLIEALTDPGASFAIDGEDLSESIATQGPGIRGDQLARSGLATIVEGGVADVVVELGLQDVESLGDVGALLVEAAADEQYARRGRLGSRIDDLFSALDGVASLTAGARWSRVRARRSNPWSPRLASQFPLRWTPDGWTLADAARPAWETACRDSIRRWEGVRELAETVELLLGRAASILTELRDMEVTPFDAERRDAAIGTGAASLGFYRDVAAPLADVPAEATREIQSIELLLKTPPILPSQ